MQNPLKWSLFALPASLGLFFGLFFGVSYPEIVRNGWPLTTCHVLASRLDSRYCCEKVCTTGCSAVTIGAPLCSTQISLVNNAFTPSRCASDRSRCPPQIGQVCDGGFHCCSNCCDTCQSCKQKCSGHPRVCTQSCSSYTCQCRCCFSTPRQSCTLSCPSCYSVDLTLKFGSGRMRTKTHSATCHQDFGKNEESSKQFLNRHSVGSSSRCFYNPQNPSQVSFDVSFTPWKWAVVSIFGIVPLFLNLAVLATVLGIIPAYRAINAKIAERRQEDMSETALLVPDQSPREVNLISTKEMSVDPEATRNLHDKAYWNADSDDEAPLLDAKEADKF
ncbi:TNFR-Cys domain-containing protein [Pleurotus pulmonarius]